MPAVRLSFSVVGGEPELQQTQRVEMRVPPPRHLDAIDREVGVWLETRDAKGQRLWATVLDATVLSPTMEIRTGVGDPGLTRAPSQARQLLSVVVPAEPAPATFHILRRDTVGAPARDLLSGQL